MIEGRRGRCGRKADEVSAIHGVIASQVMFGKQRGNPGWLNGVRLWPYLHFSANSARFSLRPQRLKAFPPAENQKHFKRRARREKPRGWQRKSNCHYRHEGSRRETGVAYNKKPWIGFQTNGATGL